jgi:hypothetical protein
MIPWVSENESVLGSSTDPYVSKPLRKTRLEENPGNVKGKEEWMLLYRVLNEVESRNSKAFTRLRMLQTLRSIHKKLSELVFKYYVPERISIAQTQKLISTFLAEASGGDRGLSVAAALFQTLGKYFQIYREVKRLAINASDKSTGSPGDIQCLGEDGELKLIIEVKERNLTLTDVRSAISKAREVSLRELLLNSPGLNPIEAKEIADLISKTWAAGTNLYQLSIKDLISVGLSLTGEAGRKDFLENVGKQLNTFNTQPSNRKRWKELLEEI